MFWIGRIFFWILGSSLFLFKFGALFELDVISSILCGLLGGEIAMFVFTLISTYIYFIFIYNKYESDFSIKPLTQSWIGINFGLLPEFISDLLGIGMGFWVHISFGWGLFGTFLATVLVGVVSDVVLGFIYPILVAAIAVKMDRGNSEL